MTFYVWKLAPNMGLFDRRCVRIDIVGTCLDAYRSAQERLLPDERIIAVTSRHPDTHPYTWMYHDGTAIVGLTPTRTPLQIQSKRIYIPVNDRGD